MKLLNIEDSYNRIEYNTMGQCESECIRKKGRDNEIVVEERESQKIE